MIQFTLTMPRNNSWNGKWSGEDNFYAVVKKLSKKKEAELDGKNFSHNWSDGWCANVSCKIVDSAQAEKARRLSRGFCGYNWMIDNITLYGSTLAPGEVAA